MVADSHHKVITVFTGLLDSRPGTCYMLNLATVSPAALLGNPVLPAQGGDAALCWRTGLWDAGWA